jgi:hypothetical protein
MGCDASNPENRQAIDQGQSVDIDLLIRPKSRADSEETVPEYRRMDSLSPVLPRSPLAPTTTTPTKMIDHHTTQSITAPDVEQIRHDRFAERFSQIDATTFHTIPRFSMPWIPQGPPDGQISHEIESYCTWVNGVLPSLLSPLETLRVKDGRNLTVSFG